MANLNGFDANTVEPSQDFSPLPEGDYLAVIVASENKPTRSGNGSYLELKFQVIEGAHKNRFLWSRLNLENPNQTAVNIARAELSAICRAVGVLTPNDSVELHNIPLTIRVKVKRREDNGEMTNEVKGYKAKASAGDTAPVTASSGSTPPWEK
jgi:hypothetical protein